MMLFSPVVQLVKWNGVTYPADKLARAHKFAQQPATKVAAKWFADSDLLLRLDGKHWNIWGLGWATMMRYYFFRGGNRGGRTRRFFLPAGDANIRAHQLLLPPTPEAGLTCAGIFFTVFALPVELRGFPLRLGAGTLRTTVRAIAVATVTTSANKNRLTTARAVVASPATGFVFVHRL